MTLEKFRESMRQEIREEGFMSAMQLVSRCTLRARERDIKISASFIDSLVGGDIKKVEYANIFTAEYRRKDLFYYSPEK